MWPAQEKRAKADALALRLKLAQRRATEAEKQDIFAQLAGRHAAGPLALLHRARGSMVRVVTRHSRGVRGCATGKLTHSVAWHGMPCVVQAWVVPSEAAACAC